MGTQEGGPDDDPGDLPIAQHCAHLQCMQQTVCLPCCKTCAVRQSQLIADLQNQRYQPCQGSVEGQ